MTILSSRVRRRGRTWIVTVQTADRERLQFRCGSPNQARYFAAVFALGPSWVPGWIRTSPAGGDPNPRKRTRLAAPVAKAFAASLERRASP